MLSMMPKIRGMARGTDVHPSRCSRSHSRRSSRFGQSLLRVLRNFSSIFDTRRLLGDGTANLLVVSGDPGGAGFGVLPPSHPTQQRAVVLDTAARVHASVR